MTQKKSLMDIISLQLPCLVWSLIKLLVCLCMVSLLSVSLLLPKFLVNFCRKIFCSGTLFMLFSEKRNIRGSNTIHLEIKSFTFSRLIILEASDHIFYCFYYLSHKLWCVSVLYVDSPTNVQKSTIYRYIFSDIVCYVFYCMFLSIEIPLPTEQAPTLYNIR